MGSLADAVRTGLLLGCLVAGRAQSADAVPCEARDLGFDRAQAGWQHVPLSKLKRDTVYALVPKAVPKVAPEAAPGAVLRASADRSASMYAAFLKPPMQVPATLSWDWKTDALVAGADNRDKRLEDAPLRVLVAFDGDPATLPEAEQKRFARAKTLTGKAPPYAVLMYIWSDHVAPETVIPSAHTSQVRMIVVASGTQGLGQWQSVRRRPADDYLKAWGRAPGPMLGVAVMTDTDNTGTQAVGEYAGIRIGCEKG